MGLNDIYRFYNIDVASEDNRHYREGWLNIKCPFCVGNPGYHLGFNIQDNYYNCHRCGSHSIKKVLSELLSLNYREVNQLLKDYDLKESTSIPKFKKQSKINIHSFKFPSYITKLKIPQKIYLKERGFNPKLIEKEFDLKATGPISFLDHINYKFRILAPIYWEGSVVSFQGRDYTNKQVKKYLACTKTREKIHHQHIIYCNPNDKNRRGICVEGITDVWRFVHNAFGVFGISYTPEQVRVISKLYDEVFVIFDPESTAQDKAGELGSELSFRGLKVKNIVLNSDPGDLDQKEANYILKQLKL